MTGFARAEGALFGTSWAWELRSVNGKSLDVRLRTPPGFEAVEAKVRPLVQGRFARGTINATLTLQASTRVTEARINEPVLAAVIEAARLIATRIEAGAPSVDGLLALKGVIEIVEAEPSAEQRTALDAAILASFETALDALAAARLSEGAAIGAVLGGRVDEIARLTGLAEACPARTPDAIRARLTEQVRVLLEGANGLDPDRLHQEAVMLAAKADVREELDRLMAHVAQARRLLTEGGPVGRKLDFLAQEFGREANTLCAKANDVSLTQIGLDLKHVIDQFREQVQNLE
ncbi:YicC/YloC family endoribonuclease [Blastochloris sulfoviridis]|uniref:YicC family protein n=1 Tax=Blastochloris sulfoviridis TaxID=50712 RepID=A0A5M6I2C2_9HYPH|nr:YicC/YloC family endoribonuclease [Blastochloris sulfoviridis]KAA5602321.1 YicC family protein [Blastochloris sulfoviridis]